MFNETLERFHYLIAVGFLVLVGAPILVIVSPLLLVGCLTHLGLRACGHDPFRMLQEQGPKVPDIPRVPPIPPPHAIGHNHNYASARSDAERYKRALGSRQ